MSDHLRILIVAGGTGGHILPAISFGRWIEERNLPAEVTYLCGNRELETSIYRALGISPIVMPLSGSPFGVKGFRSILRWKEMFVFLAKVHRLVKEIMPDVILLFGGYLSVPFILASSFLHVPIVAHEQNAVAGKATRLCSKRGIPVLAGWEECLYLDSGTFTTVGVPIRRIKFMDRQSAWESIGGKGIVPSKKFVMVMGGSIGGHSLKQSIIEVAKRDSLKNHIFVLIGGDGRPGIQQVSGNVLNVPPSWDLSAHFSLADYAVTRCGASTLSELICYDVPGVLVPWENASDGHQLMNAKLFLRLGKGKIWRENESIDQLEDMLLEVSNLHRTLNYDECDAKRNEICVRFWDAMSFSMKGEGPIGRV